AVRCAVSACSRRLRRLIETARRLIVPIDTTRRRAMATASFLARPRCRNIPLREAMETGPSGRIPDTAGDLLLLQRPDECRHHVRIPKTSEGLVLQDGDGFVAPKGRLVRADRGEGIVDIHDGHDAGAQRNRGAAESIGIARSVPAFVMMPADGERGTERLHALNQVRADHRMTFD